MLIEHTRTTCFSASPVQFNAQTLEALPFRCSPIVRRSINGVAKFYCNDHRFSRSRQDGSRRKEHLREKEMLKLSAESAFRANLISLHLNIQIRCLAGIFDVNRFQGTLQFRLR